MRVFLAGATGAIGTQLVPMLLDGGHQVTALARSAEKAQALQAAGCETAVADALDGDAVADAVAQARPEAVIHQLTAIPARLDPRKIERDFELTDRLRTEGTCHLVAAAQAAGASRILAQSIAFAYAPGPVGTVHVESDPLLSDPPGQFRRSAQAIVELERRVLEAGGLVLRYGYYYGPGTSISREGSLGREVARRRLPIVGGGTGVWSFIHIEDAARATVAALTRGTTGAYNIVDDEPARVSEWIPALAAALDAKPPLRLPAWLARPLAGEYGVMTMTRAQGASNAKAKAELGWTPRFASWRKGFRRGIGGQARA
jgi:nucleoside-diphosphate-sugar epimerase